MGRISTISVLLGSQEVFKRWINITISHYKKAKPKLIYTNHNKTIENNYTGTNFPSEVLQHMDIGRHQDRTFNLAWDENMCREDS